ncbi:UNVERIFIED_CONTAM: peptide chain release factor 3, partial [Salmonella enterica subsp. enterica serovar Weltevreden]
FDVVQYRLKDEYGVDCVFEPVQVHNARWIECDDPKKLKEFVEKNDTRIAKDHYGDLVYLASSNVNLNMAKERFPDVRFTETREHGANG